MFIFNIKINKKLFSKIAFIIILLIISFIFIFSVYIIFFKSQKDSATISDYIKKDEIFEITNENYTNILKVANDNVDSYIGCKIHVSGYIYRLLNFEDNQFVIARDMLISNYNQSVVVGFLCNYSNAKDFEDNEWVDIIGEITKGEFEGELAILNVISIEKITKPDNIFVYPPDENYIPTANMF